MFEWSVGTRTFLYSFLKSLLVSLMILPYSIDETTDFILMTFPGSIPEGTIDSGTHNSKSLTRTVKSL